MKDDKELVEKVAFIIYEVETFSNDLRDYYLDTAKIIQLVRLHDREMLREAMKKRQNEEHESVDPEWPASQERRESFDYACFQMIRVIDEVLT